MSTVVQVKMVVQQSKHFLWANSVDIDHLGQSLKKPFRERSNYTAHIFTMGGEQPSTLCGQFDTKECVWDGHAEGRPWQSKMRARSNVTAVTRDGSASLTRYSEITYLKLCTKCFHAAKGAFIIVYAGQDKNNSWYYDRICKLYPGDDLTEWKEKGLYA